MSLKILKANSFTLVEILLVTAVLIVIAGIAIPKFTSLNERIQFKETANQLAYTIRYAQNQAIVNNTQYRLEFDKEFKKYWLKKDLSSEKSQKQQFVKITGQMGQLFEIPKAIEVEADSAYVNFYQDGRIDKIKVHVCFREICKTVSTQEQSGYVFIIDEKI